MKVLWCTKLLQDVPDSGDWLHPNEKQVAAGFKFPKKRNDWLLGRWTAKTAVKSFLADSPDLTFPEIEIRSAEDGAPEVFFQNQRLPVFISLSHSNGVGFCTISEPGTELGCDLEKVEPRSEHFIRDYFTEKEKALVDHSPDQKEVYANLIWSAKESALKALRSGLRLDTRLVQVSFQMAGDLKEWQSLRVEAKNADKTFFGFWRLRGKFVLTVLSGQEDFSLSHL